MIKPWGMGINVEKIKFGKEIMEYCIKTYNESRAEPRGSIISRRLKFE